MNPKLLFLFTFYTLFFLFNPGDSYYLRQFTYQRDLFIKKEKKIDIKINPVIFLKTASIPDITAEGSLVVDLSSLTPLYEKNHHQKFFPASTAKIMTALVAYDVYKPDQIIEVEEVVNEGQTIELVKGEKLTVDNLLYAILVHSGNDAAYVLAQNYGYESFIDLMNKKAQALKMTDSVFKNPAGLDAEGQYTSPFDLALASRELLKNQYLSKIAATKEIIISDIDFKTFHKLSNVNKLLGEIKGIGGLKTGYTENAGENLVTFYKKDQHKFLIVILKSSNRFEDTKNIIKWIEENVEFEESKYQTISVSS